MSQEQFLHFNGTWRSYQQRILDDLDFHLRDKKLHVVAAPGAGKTTLGIEVIARLHRPTLILCPTNTIKNQWRERICTSFLQEKDYGIVSTLIRKPGFLTATTYQALLAAFCGHAEEEAVVAGNAELMQMLERQYANGAVQLAQVPPQGAAREGVPESRNTGNGILQRSLENLLIHGLGERHGHAVERSVFLRQTGGIYERGIVQPQEFLLCHGKFVWFFDGKVMGSRRVRKSFLTETAQKVTNSPFGGELQTIQGRNSGFERFIPSQFGTKTLTYQPLSRLVK